jgi:O-antigen ligase
VVRLADYLALGQVPWSLAYIGFLAFFVITTTYIVDLGTAAMAVAILGLVLERRRIQFPVPFRILLFFCIWAALSTALSPFPGDTTALIDLAKITLVFLVAVNVLWHRQALRIFLLAYVTCFALYPVRGTIFNYYIYGYADFGRPSWRLLFGNANDMAALTLLALALAAGFLQKDAPRLIRFGAFLACLVFPFVVLLTQSRAGFLGLAAFGMLAVFSGGRHRLRVVVALIAIALAVIAVAPTDVWQRVSGLRYGTATATIDMMDPEGSAGERWRIALTALEIIRDHPVLGVGIGRYHEANVAYSPLIGSKSVHNTYLEVLAETGAPGAFLFLWFLITLILRARRTRRDAHALRESPEWRRLQLLELGLYGFLVAGLFGTYGFLSMLYIYLAVLFAQTELLRTLAAERSGNLVAPAAARAKAQQRPSTEP